MKLFAVYSKVHLTQKPTWLDEFYKKYNPSSSGYHVTLKQPCYLKEEDIPNVKNQLAGLFNSAPIPSHEIILNFNDLAIDIGIGEFKSIMIHAEHQPSIHKLQKHILETLSTYKDYVDAESEAWEKNFKPHLTLASDINRTQYELALKELRNDYACKGVIQDVSLIIVEKMIPAEADNIKNQTIYRL
ncbi:2'-5' RNA ligase family protein [Patescibacteria group bacterium]|nr:2'-5' RNA ligase family protein [Patescibacteria group bacterium]MBP9710119.1 2'-5' RNA ligase family protein [Patescibacteria group bacterium]